MANFISPANCASLGSYFFVKNTTHLYKGSNFSLLAAIDCSLRFTAFIVSLLCQVGKQGIKSKTGVIKCCKESKITAPPDERCNIPLWQAKRVEHASIMSIIVPRVDNVFLLFQHTVSHVTVRATVLTHHPKRAGHVKPSPELDASQQSRWSRTPTRTKQSQNEPTAVYPRKKAG